MNKRQAKKRKTMLALHYLTNMHLHDAPCREFRDSLIDPPRIKHGQRKLDRQRYALRREIAIRYVRHERFKDGMTNVRLRDYVRRRLHESETEKETYEVRI